MNNKHSVNQNNIFEIICKKKTWPYTLIIHPTPPLLHIHPSVPPSYPSQCPHLILSFPSPGWFITLVTYTLETIGQHPYSYMCNGTHTKIPYSSTTEKQLQTVIFKVLTEHILQHRTLALLHGEKLSVNCYHQCSYHIHSSTNIGMST